MSSSVHERREEARSSGWRRATKANPCPVCQHADYCTVGLRFAKCMRVESPKPVASGGWLHPLENTDSTTAPSSSLPASEPRLPDEHFRAKWEPAHARRMNHPADVARLAGMLGVSVRSLELLRVGYEPCGREWWFPERNEQGWIVGVNRRLERGGRFYAKGSRPGLTYCDGWQDYRTPVLIVEGASDVAACLTLGLCALGRPSNTGGVFYLQRILASLGPSRLVIVVGENDRREPRPIPGHPHNPRCKGCQQCWPGKYGAIATARRLPGKVRTGFPPPEAKDVRAWMNASGVDLADEKALKRAGQSLLGMLLKG